MPIDPDSEQPMPHQPGVMLVHLLNRCNLFAGTATWMQRRGATRACPWSWLPAAWERRRGWA
jgi:hypothetical protein